MVDAFYADSDRFQVINDDDISFDSSRPSIQLLPESSMVSVSRNVTFPTLLASIAYLQRSYGSTPYCESWSALMEQEWGPDEVDADPPWTSNGQAHTITRNLPEEFIGSVPSGTDYIDIRARITRTQSPPPFMQQNPPLVMFAEGQWVGLPGGSCPCEYFGGMARHFDIELRGTSLYLRRFQSVAFTGQKFDWSGDPVNTFGWKTSFSTPYVPYTGAPAIDATPAVLIQSLGGNINVNRRAPWAWNSTGACSTAQPDYTSIYSCEFQIRPGRYKTS